MPIYAYRCLACGHEQDVLQKMSDAPLTVCPACSKETYAKQVTAAGFQLKGSGWYVTDFRNGSSGGSSATTSSTAKGGDSGQSTDTTSTGPASSTTAAAASSDKTPAATT
ncbi:FmdB family zinc ribbon protein [Orrella marina]|uniref:FmdB family transcriptional regulator n=1 Tax=Orrella marina TaxID=2163011 RepID=A0A2R4XLK0_9BURK|nr:FmdB family zinc ribbon protein [Orrella marina]AWB34609.1 FmdB family transcriptional regulator [Orrella marina]